MKQAAPEVRELARLLLALESNGSTHAEREALAALSIFEKMRIYMTKLVGVAGFQALLSRALGLAKAEADWLDAVHVKADATLDGFSETALKQPADVTVTGGTALLAQLLGLLIIFIGEALTLRLVQELWPEARFGDRNSGAEEVPA